MSDPYRYTFGQSVPFLRWLFGLPEWTAPRADPIVDRFVDTRVIFGPPTRVVWNSDLANFTVRVTPPSTTPWAGSLPGIPVQRIAVNAPTRTIYEFNPYTGVTTQPTVPVPPSGYYWIEGCPTPAWDQHWLGVRPETNEAWEHIQFHPEWNKTMVSARYVNGRLVEGMHTYAAGDRQQTPMSAFMLNRGDRPHRMGIAMNNYIGGDGNLQPGSGYPRCGDVLAFPEDVAAGLIASAPNAETAEFYRNGRDHGFVVYDRTVGTDFPARAGVGIIPGAQWLGSQLNATFKFSDLAVAGTV